MSEPRMITERQRHTAHKLMEQWADEHRAVTLMIERKASLEAHPHLTGTDPVHIAHYASVVDRLGGEYASKKIGRTVTSLRDLTTSEASQVISALMEWLMEWKKDRRCRGVWEVRDPQADRQADQQ